MIEMTYLTSYYDGVDKTLVISFKGDQEDIFAVRDYAKLLNTTKCDCYCSILNHDCCCESEENECEDAAEDMTCYNILDEEKELCDIVSDIITAEETEDLVNHPAHYAEHGMECILEMVMLYGFEETMSFCKLNAHKYRKRAFYKGGETDLKKSDWYVDTYKDLLFAMETDMTPLEYVLTKIN